MFFKQNLLWTRRIKCFIRKNSIDDNFDEKHFQNETLICDNLNFIQYVLGPKVNMKVAVIRYNEFKMDYIMKR